MSEVIHAGAAVVDNGPDVEELEARIAPTLAIGVGVGVGVSIGGDCGCEEEEE